MKSFKTIVLLLFLCTVVTTYAFELNILAYDADGRAEGAADILTYTENGLQYLETRPFVDGKASFKVDQGKYMISMIYTETEFHYIKKIEDVVVDQDLVLNIPFERGEIRVVTGNKKAELTLLHNKGESVDKYTFKDRESILVPPGDYTVLSENPYTGKSFEADISIADMKIVEITLTRQRPGNIYKYYNRCPGCGVEFEGKSRFCINCSMPE